jgi:hypothetical protein
VSAATSFYAAFRPLFRLGRRWSTSIPGEPEKSEIPGQWSQSFAGALAEPFLTSVDSIGFWQKLGLLGGDETILPVAW